MKKVLHLSILLLLGAVLISGCSGTAQTNTTVQTDFGRMLANVPASFLDIGDIWYADVTGVPPALSLQEQQEIIKIPLEERWNSIIANLPSKVLSLNHWFRYAAQPFAGFDYTQIDRLIVFAPHTDKEGSILEGAFSSANVTGELLENRYAVSEYGSHTYYTAREDYKIDLGDPLSSVTFATMNRASVSDDILIFFPATSLIEGIFDATDNKTTSYTDAAAGQAVMEALGEVKIGLLTTSDRLLINMTGDPSEFRFTIPDNWGVLPEYGTAAFGYRIDGEDAYLDIVLTYDDKKTAEEAGGEIINRMETYELLTQEPSLEDLRTPFNDSYQPNEPIVTQFKDGAVVKISCLIVRGARWMPDDLLGMTLSRDLLFLSPHPEQYVIE